MNRYACVALVTDYDCWHPSHGVVNVETVIQVLHKNVAMFQSLLVYPYLIVCDVYGVQLFVLNGMWWSECVESLTRSNTFHRVLPRVWKHGPPRSQIRCHYEARRHPCGQAETGMSFPLFSSSSPPVLFSPLISHDITFPSSNVVVHSYFA